MPPRSREGRAKAKAPLDHPRPELLRHLVSVAKALPVPISWTTEGRNFRFQAPLDIDGITERGLTLIGRASTAVPDRHVALNLAYRTPQGAGGTFERLDWRPIDPHNNKGNTKPDLAWQQIFGTHRHPWALNEHLTMDEALDDLPVAEAVQPEPATWAELLRLAARVWNIDGLQDLPLPPWEPTLL